MSSRLAARLAAAALFVCAVADPPASAQTAPAPAAAPSPTPAGETTFTLRNVTRVEMWNYFDPLPGGGTEPDYSFLGNRATLGAHYRGARWDLNGALQYVRMESVPRGAIGPGFLGTGGAYFFHGQDTFSYQLYLRALSIGVRDLGPGLAITAGRMSYASGAEAPSGTPAIEAIKRVRIDSRLIGDFEWALYQRAYDGVRVDLDRKAWHATGAFLMPTQGGFEESASLPMPGVKLGVAHVAARPGALLPRTEVQAFTYSYRDTRAVTARPDNSGLTATAADIAMATVGGSLVGVYPRGTGEFDAVVWGAGQFGDWYGQSHRAFSTVTEGGYRFTKAPWQPWLRAGVTYASGDGDGADDRHGTFFQMLPTVRKYSLSTAYAAMNLVDVYGQVFARPHRRVSLRAELHRLALANDADRWYVGSGATQKRGAFFGYAGRLSRAATGLGTMVEGSADVAILRWWSVNGYVGWMRGGDVVQRNFADDTLVFGYVENVLSW
jgi:hypothetical protein